MKVTVEDVIKIRKPYIRYPVIQPVADRFSPRHFSGEQIPENDLDSIFEAARQAPSAYNYQPWFYYWTKKGTPVYEKIISCLSKTNLWAKTAPILIIACYLKTGDENPGKYSTYDLGASVMSLILQAQKKNYYARQMALFDKNKLAELININKDHHPYIIIALGKIGDYSTAEEIYLKKDLRPNPKNTNIVKRI